jgi:shikimate kinase / 3-dehydroquinate synthase
VGAGLAFGQHLTLIGFMGAGKTTVGREAARLLDVDFVDLDETIEQEHGPISALFEQSEDEFRKIEAEVLARSLRSWWPSVIALGGGALTRPESRGLVLERSFPVLVEVDVETAWERTRGSDRPLARDETSFRRLYDERLPLYLELARAVARDADGILLAAGDIIVERGSVHRLAELLDEDDETRRGGLALIADERVLELHEPKLGERLVSIHTVPGGEEAKTAFVADRLWGELAIDRNGLVVALGGGATTDVAGFVAATHLRRVRWVAVPTTLVGQVDAAIGGKTGINTSRGKNMAGAFHQPLRVISDPDVLATLPQAERRAGMAEVVKTGLLAGRDLWSLDDQAMVRGCAAFKAAVVLTDPEETGRRAILNLGHTFAHALEAASGFELRHGDAVALGLLATLRLSGQPTDVVEDVLAPQVVAVDADAAWEAMRRDKKNRDGRIRLVLLEAPGRPVFPAELPDEDVRRELERLIA